MPPPRPQYQVELTRSSERYTIALTRNAYELLLQWLSGAGLEESYENGRHTQAGRAKEAVKTIVTSKISVNGKSLTLKSRDRADRTVVNASTPLDKLTIASSNGLVSSVVSRNSSVNNFNSQTQMKLGPAPKTAKLREQVARTLQDEEAAANGHGNVSPSKSALGLPNGNGSVEGHSNGDADGDVDMGDVSTKEATPAEAILKEIKIEPELDPDLISPAEGETNPPVPAVFRIADLRREVEAVKDRRKMIRLGPGAVDVTDGGHPSVTLPSVLGVTVFDGGEG
jgi:transcription initiation factor TFIID subunit 5